MDKIYIDDLSSEIAHGEGIKTYSDGENIDIELHYVSDFQCTKKIRDFIGDICTSIGMSTIDISRLTLMVDEMNNNAIEYGSQAGDINKLRFHCNYTKDTIDINIEVEDSGFGVKAKKALDMETLRAHQLKLGYGKHSSIRGRGLFMIIVKLVDRLYFKDSSRGGLIVGIKKNIKR